MPNLILKLNLSETPTPLNIVVDHTPPPDDEQPSTSADIFWRWDDEPEMPPEYLTSAAAGKRVRVPIDLKGRGIRLMLVSKTAAGREDVTNLNDATQRTFFPSEPPTLADLVFDDGPPEIEGTIAVNGGTGEIRVLRQIGSGGFTEIQTLAATATTFVDTPLIDGTYHYKLIQKGQAGESNTRTVEVDISTPPAGGPPHSLNASWNIGTYDADLDWTNDGATGNVIVERKTGIGGAFELRASLASSATTFTENVPPGVFNRTYYYRVGNTSVAGYSNEASIFVPAGDPEA